MSTGNELLMQGTGTPWCKFPSIGTTCRGTVLTEPVAQQQRDFKDNNKLLTWDNGDPKMEVVVKLKTADRNPEIDDDDGTRALHIASPNMLTAVRAACRAAKASGLEPGGELSVTYTGDGELKGNNAPKLYSAVYQPPASSGNAVLAGSGNGGQPAAANDDPGPPKPPNVPPGKWAEMSVDQRYAVVAAMKAMADSGVAAEPIPF